MSSIVNKGLAATVQDILTTELNTLANNTLSVVSAAFNNTPGSGLSSTTGDGYLRVLIEFIAGASFGSAPALNSSIDIYISKSLDGGTSYEAGGGSTAFPRGPDLILPMNNPETTAANNRVSREIWIPPIYVKFAAKNNATGVSLPSSGNKIRISVLTDQGIY